MQKNNQKELNKQLIEKYPFLKPYNLWTGKVWEGYDYETTWLDHMEPGWRESLGEDFCAEIQEEVNTWCVESQKEFRITCIKEKFGMLTVYFNMYTDNLYEITKKYAQRSLHTCIKCGGTATKITTGWYSPFCEDCVPSFKNSKMPTISVEDFICHHRRGITSFIVKE